MNRQEIFNAAYLGLASQGFERAAYVVVQASGFHNVTCRYRKQIGDMTLACAIGQLIPDEKYSYKLEPLGPRAALEMSGIELADDVSSIFLNDLQLVHDDAESPEEMKDRLITFASEHRLKVPTVEVE